jgi:hypothetical protein
MRTGSWRARTGGTSRSRGSPCCRSSSYPGRLRAGCPSPSTQEVIGSDGPVLVAVEEPLGLVDEAEPLSGLLRRALPILLGLQAVPACRPGRDADRVVSGQPKDRRTRGVSGLADHRRGDRQVAPRIDSAGRQRPGRARSKATAISAFTATTYSLPHNKSKTSSPRSTATQPASSGDNPRAAKPPTPGPDSGGATYLRHGWGQFGLTSPSPPYPRAWHVRPTVLPEESHVHAVPEGPARRDAPTTSTPPANSVRSTP